MTCEYCGYEMACDYSSGPYGSTEAGFTEYQCENVECLGEDHPRCDVCNYLTDPVYGTVYCPESRECLCVGCALEAVA